jgi:threonine synthase
VTDQIVSLRSIDIECKNCGWRQPYELPIKNCPDCGEDILYARYDLDVLKKENWVETIRSRKPGLWRYFELLPIKDPANIVTMGEGGSPMYRAQNLGAMLGLTNLWIKDERQGPTGSFKDRQASVAISVMKEIGISEAVVASTGNVAIAYSAYAARAGIQMWAFFPDRVPGDKIREVALYGTECVNVTGTYDQTKIIAKRFADQKGIYYDRGIKSIAAMESMKTMAFEIAEDLDWKAPDWFIQGVSGGMGPLGVAKGFEELMELGLVDKVPALGLIQSEGCTPIVDAFNNDLPVAVPVDDPSTIIATLSTGNPGRAYQLLYEVMQEWGGGAAAASDEEAFEMTKILAHADGISVEPATAVAFAGMVKLVRDGTIKPDDVVVFNCSGHTFPVEKSILGDQWFKELDISGASRSPLLPTTSLVEAIAQVEAPVRRILVIEDSSDAARLMERILRASYEVHVAIDGRQGLEMAHNIKPDLIITDLMMPEVDGFTVIERLKSDHQFRDTPIIVLSAKELTAQERARLTGQVETLLQKGSFLSEELLQRIVNALN